MVLIGVPRSRPLDGEISEKCGLGLVLHLSTNSGNPIFSLFPPAYVAPPERLPNSSSEPIKMNSESVEIMYFLSFFLFTKFRKSSCEIL